jgi:hypothetical protein
MSSGRGLKNVHWSFSKSIRTNEPNEASGSSPWAWSSSLMMSVKQLVSM